MKRFLAVLQAISLLSFSAACQLDRNTNEPILSFFSRSDKNTGFGFDFAYNQAEAFKDKNTITVILSLRSKTNNQLIQTGSFTSTKDPNQPAPTNTNQESSITIVVDDKDVQPFLDDLVRETEVQINQLMSKKEDLQLEIEDLKWEAVRNMLNKPSIQKEIQDKINYKNDELRTIEQSIINYQSFRFSGSTNDFDYQRIFNRYYFVTLEIK